MSDEPPWRRPPRDQFPGVPAWGAPTSRSAPDPFAVTALPPVTRDWAWNGSDGSGVRVCILDSGVDGEHPLVGGIDGAFEVVTGADGELEVAAAAPVDPLGHGTACASLIRGIAPGASLTSVRVLTEVGHGSGAALIRGLEWAIQQGFDVINMSLSTTRPQFSQALHELTDQAYFRRCVLVASAHNMPLRSFPWPFASVISVASHNEVDPMTYYYNPAPPVDFYARGIGVRVAWTGGKEILSTGNSFATPHITGLCARILGKHRSLTPFQLKTVLYLSASNVAVGDDGGNCATD